MLGFVSPSLGPANHSDRSQRGFGATRHCVLPLGQGWRNLDDGHAAHVSPLLYAGTVHVFCFIWGEGGGGGGLARLAAAFFLFGK